MRTEPALLFDVLVAVTREGPEASRRRAQLGPAVLVGSPPRDAPGPGPFATRLNLRPSPPDMEAAGLALDMLCWPLAGSGWLSSGSRIGRTRQNDVSLSDPDISRHHARINIDEDKATLVDLGSANGTFVNGTRLAADRAVPIADWDRIRFGAVTMTFLRTPTLVRTLLEECSTP